MTVSWVCGICGTAVNGDAYDPYCPTCGEDSISIPATHFHPEPQPRGPGIRVKQRIAICQHFSAYGEVNKQRRMNRLSELTGRTIHDYDELTEAEATQVLERWTHEPRA